VLATGRDHADGAQLEKELEARAGGRFVAVELTSSDAPLDLVTRAVEETGGLHGLVNNAGIHRVASVADTSAELYDEVMDVNLRAAVLLAAAAVPAGIEIVIAGSSELWLTPEHAASSAENQYVKQVREAAAGLNIRWLGSVPLDTMPSVYAACDICVVPSAWDDPFPLVACEAMAAGKPVIASRRGGLSQIVVDGETGLRVPSEDPSALRGALDTLLNSRELADILGEQARERSRQFSWNRIATQVDAIYQELDTSSRVQRTRAPGTYLK
jgi:glycosyltransferase involved in cell wall biosynthesis